jgi:dihydroflavonol-4-reductase
MYLVTGATGLVGKVIVEKLVAQNLSVVALYRNQATIPAGLAQHKSIIWRKADIIDVPALEEAFEGVTHVYHTAALVSFNPKDKATLHKINVEGTANIVNIALANNIKKLVHISSVAALGRLRNEQNINESMYWTPETSNSVYGASKYLGEMQVWRALEEGLPVAIVNPSIILGCSNWDMGSAAIFKNAYNEFKYYSNGTSGFVDVEDVANACIALMQSTIVGERYIINGVNESYRNIFNKIARCFGKKLPTKEITPTLAGIVWRLAAIKSFFTGKAPFITKETAETALATIAYNNSKSLSIPNFSYSNIDESIKRICAEYKEKYKLV